MAQRGFEGLSSSEELDIKDRAMDEAPIGITLADPSRDDNPMVYINEAFEQLTGYDATEVIGRNCRFLQSEDTDPDAPAAMRRAIDAEEPVSVELLNERRDGEPFWNEVTIAPVHDDDGELTHFVGFQQDVTARVEAERERERERERLDRLVDRIEGIVADVTADVIRADDRDDVERVLCERLAATTPFVAAQVLRERTEGSFDVVAGDGAGEGTGDDAGRSRRTVTPGDGARRALDTGRSTEVGREAWGEAADDAVGDDVASVWLVPIASSGVDYGVLAVHATEPIDDRELTVLESLARTVGTAINAIERGQMLTAGSAHELRFAFSDPDAVLAALSGSLDERCVVRDFVRHDDGGVGLVVTASADLAAVEERLHGIAGATVRPLREEDGRAVLDVRLDEPWIVDAIADRAGDITEIAADDDRLEVTVRVPHRSAARELRDYVMDRYPGASLLESAEVEDGDVTADQDVTGDLTAKQREALQKAYYGGYFDRPRLVTGDDLAETMDISRATFNQHLRAAERKVLAAAFGDEGT